MRAPFHTTPMTLFVSGIILACVSLNFVLRGCIYVEEKRGGEGGKGGGMVGLTRLFFGPAS